jgi:hypothetical protein
MASAASSVVGAASRNSNTGSAEGQGVTANQYFVDSLFRTDHPTVDPNDSAVRAEAGVILANALRQSRMPAADRIYLGELISAKTGLTQSEAEKRVSDIEAADEQAADAARKNLAHSMYWMFLALLIGAFCATFAATVGGRERDRVLVRSAI